MELLSGRAERRPAEPHHPPGGADSSEEALRPSQNGPGRLVQVESPQRDLPEPPEVIICCISSSVRTTTAFLFNFSLFSLYLLVL